jgi:uncharacterized protein DUF1579
MNGSKEESTMADETQMSMPTPNPKLRELDRFVGTWSLEGHPVASAEMTVRGDATYRWLPGGFFLEQRFSVDFMRMRIDSLELVGYDAVEDALTSTVYSNLSPAPLPYRWEVEGDSVRITVSYSPLDATFTGRFGADGETFEGGWRPNPGADETVNVPYDIAGRRVG